MKARLKTSAPPKPVRGALLVGFWLGATASLYAVDPGAPARAPEPRDRGASLVGTLNEAFPTLGPRLKLSSTFESTTWSHGDDRIQGLRPHRAPAPGAAGEEPPVDVVFPVRASDPVVAQGDGIRVILRPRGAASAPARIVDGKLVYLDVYEETDSIHVVQERSTEEHLYLRSAHAPVRFEYDLVEARGVSSIEVEDGQVRFLDADDEGLVILPPFVADSAGRHSASAARWELSDGKGPDARRLVLRLDPTGLDYPLVVDPTWIRTGDLGPARQDGVGILLHNNKVLVMGAVPEAALYDIATGTWSLTGPGWPGRSRYGAVMLRDGRVLATGGSDPLPFADCHLYDPTTDTWTPADTMNEARASHTATLLNDGTVLVAGGEGTLATAEIYDPVLDNWSYTGPLNNGKARHTATKLLDGRVVVIGGVTGAAIVTGITEIYSGGTWTPMTPMAPGQTQHSATLLRDGRILVVGGGLISTNLAQIYNPSLDQWTGTASLTFARSEHTATMLPSGRVLVAGGIDGVELSSAEIYDPAGPSWVTIPVPDMNFARRRHAATMLSDGRVLVVGGWGPGALLTAELLDADAPDWPIVPAPDYPIPDMNRDRNESTATLLKDGRVLVAGGQSEDTAELFDPKAGPPPTWTFTGNTMSRPRWRHSATLLLDGRVLVAGSVASAVAARTADVYDPSGNTWSATPNMAGERSTHVAALLPDGDVLIAGGQDNAAFILDTAERFDPRTDSWRTTTSMGTARWRPAATLLRDGRVLVTGGFEFAGLDTAQIYDPATETWTPTAGTMTVPRYFHTSTLLPTGQVLLVGGETSASSAELYDPLTGTFVPTGNLNVPRDSYFTATLLPNGRVLVVGGLANPQTAEVYDPATGNWTVAPNPSGERAAHAAALLPDGRVLVAGSVPIGPTAEVYDVGRGEDPAWRPALATATDPLLDGSPLLATGLQFEGLGEGSTGQGHMHSATNYPLVQLRRLDNEDVRWLLVDPAAGWKDTDFTSLPVGGLAPGPALVTVFTNGIPSDSRVITLECGPPVIDTQPTALDACVGAPASFTVSTSAPSPAFQWRKGATPLSDGGAITGSSTAALSIDPTALADAGSYDVVVSTACSSTDTTSLAVPLTVSVGLSNVSIGVVGPTNICATCLGGTATESHLDGGPVSYQWGYRRVPLGTIFDIPGQTGPSYVLNGSDFPGIGSYLLVVRTTPLCGATLVSNEVPVAINDIVPADDVEHFTVTSRNTENVLEWVNPAGFNIVGIHVNSGPTCVPPTDPLNLGTWLTDEIGVAGMRHRFPHSGLTPGFAYCYTLFVDKGGFFSAGRSNRGRTVVPGPVQWAFSTGVFSLTAPTVGGAGVIATSNDHVVHAMIRGASPPAGEWPPGWLPMPVSGPVQSRSPIVPIDVGPVPSNPVVYLGSQDGNVYVVDGAQGGMVPFPWAPVPLGGSPGQAAPAGIFQVYGGVDDYLLVGTRDMGGDNRFYAIDPYDGPTGPVYFYDNLAGTGAIGMINAMAAVDYATDRVFFASHRHATGSPSTLWCLDLLDEPPAAFSFGWERDLNDIDSSPVLMGGRVYVGSIEGGGTAYSVNAGDGSDYSFPHNDGQVKGFVWPDWYNPGDLYFAGDSLIWALHDFGTYLDYKPPLAGGVSLGGAIPTSAVLVVPGTQRLYVGADDGHLYEVDFSQDPPFVKSVQLGDGGATVGAPSLDWPNDVIHVGTEAGVFYTVDIPLP